MATDTPRTHVDLIERCDCGSSHFCSVQYWRDDDSWPDGYFEVAMADHYGKHGLPAFSWQSMFPLR